MAVASASNVDPRVLHWLRKLAKRKGWVKTQREMERALQRHGRGVELQAYEVRLIAHESLPPATRELIDTMHVKLLAAERYERAAKDAARSAVLAAAAQREELNETDTRRVVRTADRLA